MRARDVLDAVLERRRAADRAEADLLALVVHWADLHSVEPDHLTVDANRSPTGEAGYDLDAGLAGRAPVRTPLAGPGTPAVSEDAVAELGAALRVPYRSALALVGDAVELCWRLPRLWALVQGGFLRAWKARQVAHLTTTLPDPVVAFVDTHIAVTAGRNHVPALAPLVHEALPPPRSPPGWTRSTPSISTAPSRTSPPR